MNKYKNIKKYLESICPIKNIIEGDFVGEQLNFNKNIKIEKILIALDCTNEIIEKAIKTKTNLIVTHHPFFYPNKEEAIKVIEKEKQLKILKKNNISVYSLHTNYDEMFLKHILLKKFKIKNKKDFKNTLCVAGELKEPKKLKIFIKYINKIFNIKSCDFFGDEEQIIKTISISPGSGGSNLKTVYENNIDLLLTGELNWKYWLKVKEYKQKVIVLGHQMEEEFVNHMYDIFKNYSQQNNLKIKIEKHFFGPIKKNSND